jgi:hypothetical protein
VARLNRSYLARLLALCACSLDSENLYQKGGLVEDPFPAETASDALPSSQDVDPNENTSSTSASSLASDVGLSTTTEATTLVPDSQASGDTSTESSTSATFESNCGSETQEASSTDLSSATELESSDSTPSESTDESTSESSEETKPSLGESPDADCELSAERYAELQLALATQEVSSAGIAEIYRGVRGRGGLNAFVRKQDVMLHRMDGDGRMVDDVIIEGALETGTLDALRSIQGTVENLSVRAVRAYIREALDLLEDPPANPALRVHASDAAYCIFGATLAAWHERPADSLQKPPGLLQIREAFSNLHHAIVGESNGHEPDLFAARIARQAIDKGLDHLNYGHFLAALRLARAANSPLYLGRARAHFEHVRERMRNLNSPGIARIDAALAGEPNALQLEAIAHDVLVAYSKHLVRRIPDAIDSYLVGDPLGAEQVAQAFEWGQIVVSDLAKRVDGFNVEAWNRAWAHYLQAAQQGSSADARSSADTLMEMACAYQAALGLSVCAGRGDEALDVVVSPE